MGDDWRGISQRVLIAWNKSHFGIVRHEDQGLELGRLFSYRGDYGALRSVAIVFVPAYGC